MSDAERQRLAGLSQPRRRAQFIAGRWLLRELLVQVHGGTPDDWRLTAGRDGPPQLLEPHGKPRVFIGLSHSADQVAGAVAPVPFGLDIEHMRGGRDFPALAAAFCGAAELRRFTALPPAQQPAFVYTLWTLKEAWIKGHGESMTPGRMAQLHAAPVQSDSEANAWQWVDGDLTVALWSPSDLSPDCLDGRFPASAAARWRVRDSVNGS